MLFASKELYIIYLQLWVQFYVNTAHAYDYWRPVFPCRVTCDYDKAFQFKISLKVLQKSVNNRHLALQKISGI